MILKAVYNILSNNSGVTNIVSGNIFPVVLPEGNTLPAVVYSVVDARKSDTKEAAGSMQSGIFEVKCFVEGGRNKKAYKELDGLSSAVDSALSYSSGTFNGVTVQHISSPEERDIFEEDAREDGVYGKVLDFRFFIAA